MTRQPYKSPQRQRAAKLGWLAESIAGLLLRLKGYRIIARRVKTPVGEIDLITRKGDMLCFIEVKYRRTLQLAISSISPWQRRRIERAALYFCQGRGIEATTLRFDVIALAPYHLPRHIPHAWR